MRGWFDCTGSCVSSIIILAPRTFWLPDASPRVSVFKPPLSEALRCSGCFPVPCPGFCPDLCPVHYLATSQLSSLYTNLVRLAFCAPLVALSGIESGPWRQIPFRKTALREAIWYCPRLSTARSRDNKWDQLDDINVKRVSTWSCCELLKLLMDADGRRWLEKGRGNWEQWSDTNIQRQRTLTCYYVSSCTSHSNIQRMISH